MTQIGKHWHKPRTLFSRARR